MWRTLGNIYRLGIKELWSLWRDPVMLVLIFFTFTISVYNSAASLPEALNLAPLAVVDEDDSPLSRNIIAAFYPPDFLPPTLISAPEMDARLDAGTHTFALYIPANFQKDVLAGRPTQLQLNVDATRMTQAFTGSAHIQQVVLGEVEEFRQRYRSLPSLPVDLELRARFNPSLEPSWFGSLTQLINHITLLSIILTGAALIREREHGTIEHLLAMPVTPLEIMVSKVWAMALVVLVASAISLHGVVMGLLAVPIAGSLTLFFSGATLVLFATTSMGIFLATLARNMPQFGMLLVLVLLPLQMLSGGMTPRESMPDLVRNLMSLAPTTHFVEIGQAILFRGAGLEIVWPSLLALGLIGGVFFAISLARFRRSLARLA